MGITSANAPASAATRAFDLSAILPLIAAGTAVVSCLSALDDPGPASHCKEWAPRSNRQPAPTDYQWLRRKDTSMNGKVEARLQSLGIVLPAAPNPVANYVP